MPRKKSVTRAEPKQAVRKYNRKVCTSCGRDLAISKFYKSMSPLFAADGYVNICKECCDNAILTENGTVEEDKLKVLLQRMDKPYYKDVWESAIDQFGREHPYVMQRDMKFHAVEIFHSYMRMINGLHHLRNKNYLDGEKAGFYYTKERQEKLEETDKDKLSALVDEDGKLKTILDDDQAGRRKRRTKQQIKEDEAKQRVGFIEDDDFEVTDEIIRMFGEGYTKMEYRKMKQKYDKLRQGYIIQTNLHQEALITYIRFKVKEEDATAKGDVDEAKKWYDAAQNAADKAKLSPKQLSDADLQKGVNSFSEISQALEQAVDIIDILPKFKYRPADSVDFTIWCYINYARKLKGLPTVSYEEVYKFYDDMKREYLAQYGDPYGIFDGDPTEGNRPNVEKFITLPKDYESIEEPSEPEGGDEADDGGESQEL